MLPSCKVGRLFKSEENHKKTIHEKVVISRKPLKLYTMYTKKELEAKIKQLEKEHEDLAKWLRCDNNIEDTDNPLFYMLLAFNSLQHTQVLNVLSLKNYLEENPDAYKY